MVRSPAGVVLVSANGVVAGLYWKPVFAKISFTSTRNVTRARRLIVCRSDLSPMAKAPPSPLAPITCTG